MKHFYKTLIAIAMVMCYSVTLKAQFSGVYAPANWGNAFFNSNGSVNTAGAPASIVIVGSDNQSLSLGTTDFTIAVPQTGLLSFNWAYTTIDGSNWDYPMFLINGVATQVNGYIQVGGSQNQSGSQPCISVTAGQIFGFRVHSVDNQAGAATCIFSNFAFSTGNLTVTPASVSVCPGTQVTFSTTGGSNYSWSGGITEGVAFTPTASMIYTVTAGSGLCISTKTAAVTYNPPLTILGPTNHICANASATLIGAGGTTYSWSTGVTSPSIIITPSVTTTYTVSGMSALGCNTQGVKTITVDPGLPVVTASASSAASGVCPGKTLTLNGGGALTYTWTGGTPTVTNGVAFAPSVSNIYTVTGGNGCGTATAAISVSIHPLPNLTPVASSASLCSGSSLTLTSAGNSTSTAWYGGPIAITAGVGFNPTSTITYSVIGTSALSCTAMATVPVTVVTTPILAPIKTPSIVCLGGSSTLTASGATNYTWTSATQTVFINPFIVTPSVFGTEVFTVTKANANCYDTKTISIITNSLPSVFALATPTLICSMSQSTLAVAGGQTYTWTAPGGFQFQGASPIVNPSVTSVYTVAAHDGTCINTTTLMITTNPIPTISISGSTNTICKGGSITLTVTGGLTYTWTNTANNSTLFTNSISQSPTVTAGYTAVGINNVGCTSSSQYFVQVFQLPTVNATVIKPLVCSGGLSTLTASGANTYTWEPVGALTASTVVTSTNSVSGPVIYTVTGMSNTTGCSNTKTVQVNVFVPALSINGTTNTCMGGNVTLQGFGGNANTYTWNTGTGNPIVLQTITASLTAPSIFTLSAVTNSGNVQCPGTKTVQLGIYFNPTITAVAQRTTVCRYEFFELYGGGGVDYSWSNGMQGSTVTVGPINNVQTLNYTVTGTDANGCASTATIQVKVSGCSGIDEVTGLNNQVLVYPNPNNGEFTIQADKKMTLTLSNELGQVIRTIELSGSSSQQISVSDLAKGIYFISGQGVHQKIIVAK